MKRMEQKSKYTSPWPLSLRVKKLLWDFTWSVCCRTTPKPFNIWRVFIFKLFGGRVDGHVFIHQSARIHFPWNVTLFDRASLGERCWIYSLGSIQIGSGATIAQEVFLCGGSHDFSSPKRALIVGNIDIGEDAFISARVTILPDVNIGKNTIVGTGSVVTKSVQPCLVVAGNPAVTIKSKFML